MSNSDLFLSMRWGDTFAGVGMNHVFEIVRDVPHHPLPGVRRGVTGIMIYRGYSIPVYDPAKWHGFFTAPTFIEGIYTVILQSEESLDAFITDDVDMLSRSDLTAMSPDEDTPPLESPMVKSVWRHKSNTAIYELEPNSLFRMAHGMM